MERTREIHNNAALRRLVRRAPRRRQAPGPSLSVDIAVTIRYAFPDDEPSVRRLAVLDSAATPPAPLLVAEVEGELGAALSLATGETIADPFRPSTALIELLQARAEQLTGERPGIAVRFRPQSPLRLTLGAQVRARRAVQPDR